jgi:hypothetical protein
MAYWRDRTLHLDVIEGDIPISAVLTEPPVSALSQPAEGVGGTTCAPLRSREGVIVGNCRMHRHDPNCAHSHLASGPP